MTTDAKPPPIHPGEVLIEEFLVPMNITQYRLAKSIGVDARRIHSIVHGERSITAETALLLARFFGNSPAFWMGLQSQYDLEVAQDRLSGRPGMIAVHTPASGGGRPAFRRSANHLPGAVRGGWRQSAYEGGLKRW